MKLTGMFLYKMYNGPRPRGFTTRIPPEQTEYHEKEDNVKRALERAYGYMEELESHDPLISCEMILTPIGGITTDVEFKIYSYQNGRQGAYCKHELSIGGLEIKDSEWDTVKKIDTLYHLLKEYISCQPGYTPTPITVITK
jgi:hypothetical protein